MSPDTPIQRFFLAGGWPMAAMAGLAFAGVFFAARGLLALRRRRVEKRIAPAVAARLEEILRRHEALTADDVRAEVDAAATALYAVIQPLVAVYVVAPLAGLAATAGYLVIAWNQTATPGATPVAAAAAAALLPSLWGAAVAALAYTAWVFLKLRLYRIERTLLTPAAEKEAQRLLARPSRTRPDPARGADAP